MYRILHKAVRPWQAREQQRLDYLSREQLVELQWHKLQRLLRLAYDHTSFYRRRFQEIGATPDDIKTPGDFSRIPMLTRTDILNHAEEMLIPTREKLHQGKTGGSTGHPLTYYYDHANKYYRKALWQRVDSWIGAAGKRPVLYLWGVSMRSKHPATIHPWHRWTMQSFRYGIKAMSQNDLGALTKDFLQIRPVVVYGYASLLLLFANYIRENGVPILAPRLVVSVAETLPPENRTLMEDAFRAPVYNRYGSNENTYMASECPVRQGLHVILDHVYLEIIAEDRSVKPGEPGYIAVTDLDNLAMPFIRYRNDDIATWSRKEACACGRNLPLLETILGRETDFLFDSEGAMYSGSDIIEVLQPVSAGGLIHQFQFLQEERGSLCVRVVIGPAFHASVEGSLRQILNSYFCGKMEVSIDWVENITPEPSGKTRFIKSMIPYNAVWQSRD